VRHGWQESDLEAAMLRMGKGKVDGGVDNDTQRTRCLRGPRPSGLIGTPAAGVNPARPPLLPRELVIAGQIKSGKNRILITRTGHRYPPKEFKAWRDGVVGDLVKQWKQPSVTVPVRLYCQYWPGDRRTRDVSGMADALFHVLVKAGVLKDDGLVWDLLWYRQPMNRKGPKVLITITEWGI
jgi:Holliday junction resolvase RusA-like endonuclease